MSDYKIQDSLSFEQFRKLADREPNLSGKWIYKLTQAYLNPVPKIPYPSFKFVWTEDFYFLDYEEALQDIQNFKNENLYCSWLTQLPMGIFDTLNGNKGATWLFDKDGQMLDYTSTVSCGKGIESCFLGRSVSRQRFKPGDIAEYVNDEGVSLVVIVNEVPTIEDCWKDYNESKSYFREFTWDSYNVIVGINNLQEVNISPVALMKPRFEIPDEIVREMKTWPQKVAKIEPPDDYELSLELDQMSDAPTDFFYHLGMRIGYEVESERHLLYITDQSIFRARLRMDMPAYETSNYCEDRLSFVQLEFLDEYLHEEINGKTRWWHMLRDWNERNQENQLPLNLPIPNYKILFKTNDET